MTAIPTQLGSGGSIGPRINIPSGELNVSGGPGVLGQAIGGAVTNIGAAIQRQEQVLNASRINRLSAEGKGEIMRQIGELQIEATTLNDPDEIRSAMKGGLAAIQTVLIDQQQDQDVKDRLGAFFETRSSAAHVQILGIASQRQKISERQALVIQTREGAQAAASAMSIGLTEEALAIRENVLASIDESAVTAFDTPEEVSEAKRAANITFDLADFQTTLDTDPIQAIADVDEGVFQHIPEGQLSQMRQTAVRAVDQNVQDRVAVLRRDDPNKARLFLQTDPGAQLPDVATTVGVLERSIVEQMRRDGIREETAAEQLQTDISRGISTMVSGQFTPGQPPVSDFKAGFFLTTIDEAEITDAQKVGLRNQVINNMQNQSFNRVKSMLNEQRSDPISNPLPTTNDVLEDRWLGLPAFSSRAGQLVGEIKSAEASLLPTQDKHQELLNFLQAGKPIPDSHRSELDKEFNNRILPLIQQQVVVSKAQQGNPDAQELITAFSIMNSPDENEDVRQAASEKVAQLLPQVVDDLDIAKTFVEVLPSARMVPKEIKISVSKGLRSDDVQEFQRSLAVFRDGVSARIPDKELVLNEDDQDLANTILRTRIPGQNILLLRNQILKDMEPTTVRRTEGELVALRRRGEEELVGLLLDDPNIGDLFETLERGEKRPLSNEEILNKVPADLTARYLEQLELIGRTSSNPEVAITRLNRRIVSSIGVNNLDGQPRVMFLAPQKMYQDMQLDIGGHDALTMDYRWTLKAMLDSDTLDLPNSVKQPYLEMLARVERDVQEPPGFFGTALDIFFPREAPTVVQARAETREAFIKTPQGRASVLEDPRFVEFVNKHFRIRVDPRFTQRASDGSVRPEYTIVLITEEDLEGQPIVRFEEPDDGAQVTTGYARWRPDMNTGIVNDLRSAGFEARRQEVLSERGAAQRTRQEIFGPAFGPLSRPLIGGF